MKGINMVTEPNFRAVLIEGGFIRPCRVFDVRFDASRCTRRDWRRCWLLGTTAKTSTNEHKSAIRRCVVGWGYFLFDSKTT